MTSIRPPSIRSPGRSLPPGPRKVLVVDDDDVARQTMVDLLEHAGHAVVSLPSPIGATKTILESNIDVVVLDVLMPSLRGDKLATLLNRNPRLRHVGVILVTSDPTPELTSVATNIGAAAIIVKEHVHTDLAPAVRKAGYTA